MAQPILDIQHATVYRGDTCVFEDLSFSLEGHREMGSGMSIDLLSERLTHADFALCIPLCHIGAARWLIMEGKSRKEST